MFGLTLEKLFLVAVIAGFVLGPTRLPGYAHRLAHWARTLRGYVEATRTAAERDLGVPLQRTEWQSLNLRRYDPRRIVTDALTDTIPTPSTEKATPNAAITEQMIAEAEHIRPGQKYLITGTSSHPARIRLDSLPPNDPRRIAAEAQPTAPNETLPHDGEEQRKITEPAVAE